eukprot:NODE_130_length_1835_cov_255.701568_g90_i0.p1 GENE.NODE_130_length_1835_cov_255.701568_g90_i0~~NODE_130_length_1835_cov_255.701568_g90_i0.p1  ORF type:complete len:451 (-),score=212.10 NODE_130_length_1835_cov_255.701568_g90_i0:483-1772(-)
MADLELKAVVGVTDADTRLARNKELLTIIKRLDVNDEKENWVGPYAMHRILGKGSFATVRMAFNRSNPEEEVAIKIIDNTLLLADPENKKRMDRELAVLQKLKHPYLMELHDVIDTKTHKYVVLEYIPGGELFDYILKQGGKLTMDERFKFFTQTVMAVNVLHRHQWVHRDVSLSNLLLDINKDLKLADFGMACPVPKNGFLTDSVGSPAYACPEIIRGVKYRGYAADVWSLGVVLFVLLTGTLPFAAENQELMFNKIKSADYKIPPELPDPAQDLVRNMIVVDPQERLTMHQIQAHPWIQGKLSRLTPEMRKLWEAEFPPCGSTDGLHERLLAPNMMPVSKKNLQFVVAWCPKCDVKAGMVVSATTRMKTTALAEGQEPAAEYVCDAGCGGTFHVRDGLYRCDCSPEGWNCCPTCAADAFEKRKEAEP